MPISTPVILGVFAKSLKIQYPTDFDGESLLWLVRAASGTGFTWPSDGNSSSMIVGAFCPTCDGANYDGGDSGQNYSLGGGGSFTNPLEKGGNDPYFYTNVPTNFGSASRYRWQTPTATNFSDYIEIAELPELHLFNSEYYYKYFTQIGRGQSGSFALGEQKVYVGTPSYEWHIIRYGASPPYVTSISPVGWSLAFDDATGIFTITTPTDAIPGTYYAQFWGESAHGHLHETTGWFEVPCVKINIVISQSEGA